MNLGKPLRLCPHCDAEIQDLGKLCPGCGRNLLKPSGRENLKDKQLAAYFGTATGAIMMIWFNSIDSNPAYDLRDLKLFAYLLFSAGLTGIVLLRINRKKSV